MIFLFFTDRGGLKGAILVDKITAVSQNGDVCTIHADSGARFEVKVALESLIKQVEELLG